MIEYSENMVPRPSCSKAVRDIKLTFRKIKHLAPKNRQKLKIKWKWLPKESNENNNKIYEKWEYLFCHKCLYIWPNFSLHQP